jgi:putative hydrolase of the HAD superfamily
VTEREHVQAVSFDVGGTLIDPWPSVGHVYAAVAAEAGLAACDPAVLTAQFVAAWKSKVDFDCTREAWARLVVRTFGGSEEEFGPRTAFFERLYNRFTEASAWRIYPDVLPTLRALRDRGLKLAAISNWDDRLRPLLRNLELDRWFAVVEVSAESGFHKPAPEIFRRAAQALDLPASSVLHVGDSRTEDLQGAQAAGFQALLLARHRASGAPEEIASLSEVVKRI